MKHTRFIQGSIPVLLSAVFPGLGQWYNKQVWRGVAFFVAALFLIGIILNQVDIGTLQRLSETGAPPDNIGTIFLSTMVLLVVILWSMYDAGQEAYRSQQAGPYGGNKTKT